jgi:hypothetical protein
VDNAFILHTNTNKGILQHIFCKKFREWLLNGSGKKVQQQTYYTECPRAKLPTCMEHTYDLIAEYLFCPNDNTV